MFYEPRTETSGLPHSPVNSFCVPRPIGWISTVSKDGINNLAPFSQFQNVTFDPPTVLFSSCGTPNTDTARNAEETGEFVWNMATYELRDLVAKTAFEYPPEVDEFQELGIETLPSNIVKPLRVAASPAHFECKVSHIVDVAGRVPESCCKLIIGEVVGIHLRDDALTEDGRVDVLKLQPLARLGYLDYSRVTEVFELETLGVHHNRETEHDAPTEEQLQYVQSVDIGNQQ